jgi:LDH2 family malate/lactate/ureidoglycolate dehydrogenase
MEDSMVRIAWDRLVDFAAELLTRKGVGEENARYLADLAVRSHAFGSSPAHGLGVLSYYDSAVGEKIDPAAEPIVARDRAASVLIDGNRVFAQLAMRAAKEACAGKAREYGVAMAAIRNTGWIAALGVNLLSLAEQGLLAQAWAHHSGCKDCPPFGGLDGKFSTNPVALAFPAGPEAMVADFSTSAYSMGGIGRMIRAGRKAPEKLFIEPDGTLSDDPNVMERGGTMFHLGGAHFGYKGYALSLWCEATAALAGGSANNPDVPARQSLNLLVIDPESFAGADYFLAEMQRFVAHVKSGRVREGFDCIRLPGERAAQALREARRDGVPVSPDMIEQLNEIAARHDLEPLGA